MFNMNGVRKFIASVMNEAAKEVMPKDAMYDDNSFEKKRERFEEKRIQSTNEVNRIKIDASCFDVKVIPTDASDIEASIKGNTLKNPPIEFITEVVEKEFCVKVRMKSGTFIGSLYLEILVPRESRFKRISVITSTGDIEISDKMLVEMLEISTSSGDVSLEKLRKLNGINIKTSTGDVYVNDGVETGSLKIETSAGEVEVSDDISADEIDINTSTGDIELSDTVHCKSIKITTGAGEVDVNAMFAKVDINTSIGDVTVETEAKQDISMFISTKNGDVSIDLDNIGTINQTIKSRTGDVDCNYSGNGMYTADIRVTTSTGDIEIS